MARYLSNGEASEDAIHKALIAWVRVHPNLKHKAGLIIHCPNESKRSLSYGKKMKDMGMRPGVSDLLIAMPNKGYHGAWIELKSKTGKLSASQKQFLEDMSQQGYFTATCYSLEEAIEVISNYCF